MTRPTPLDDDERWLVGIGAQVHGRAEDDDESHAEPDPVELDDLDEDEEASAGDTDAENDDDDQPAAGDDSDTAADTAPQLTEAPVFAAAVPDQDCAAPTEPRANIVDTPPADTRRRFTPWVLAAVGGAAALATVFTAVVSNINSPAPPSPPATPSTTSPVPRHAPAAPPPPPPSDANADGPLPFTATSDCNDAGSTPAQSVAVADSPTPWICVIDGPGQRLDIVLGPPGMPQSYVITGVVIVPGAIGRPGRPETEPDPWLAHQVVTRLQWSFNDPANTVMPQNTHNVRGEAPMAIPHITASKITVIIQETSPPPAPQPTTTEQPAPGGVFGSVLGPPAPPPGVTGPVFPGPQQQSETNLRTFAVSSIKIIGHKAI